jgi:spermidine synthase
MTILYNETTDNISIQIKENTKSRWMCFDGKSAEQSAMSKEHPRRLVLKYTQRMVEHIDTDTTGSVLVLGMGGGSIPSYLHHKNNNIKIDVVEIYKEVIQAAYDYFLFPVHDNITVYAKDALDYINNCTKSYDVIVVDVSPKGTKHLQTESFCRSVFDRVNDGGRCIINKISSVNKCNEFKEMLRGFYSEVTEDPTKSGNHIVCCTK